MSYIDLSPPWVYMCSPSWTPLLPPSLSHPSGSSQCTSPEHPVSCIKPGLVIRFTYDNIHVSMPFSQTIPPSPSPTESKRLFYTSVSLLLSRIQGYHYYLSKFHIYALVYCITSPRSLVNQKVTHGCAQVAQGRARQKGLQAFGKVLCSPHVSLKAATWGRVEVGTMVRAEREGRTQAHVSGHGSFPPPASPLLSPLPSANPVQSTNNLPGGLLGRIFSCWKWPWGSWAQLLLLWTAPWAERLGCSEQRRQWFSLWEAGVQSPALHCKTDQPTRGGVGGRVWPWDTGVKLEELDLGK